MVVVVATRRGTRAHGKHMPASGGAVKCLCIHREIFSINMPGSVQKQINKMLTNSSIVYNTRRESVFLESCIKRILMLEASVSHGSFRERNVAAPLGVALETLQFS